MNIGYLAVMFIVGVFFIWKGSIKISNKTEAWPKSKKIGRIVGVVLLIPFIVSQIITITNGNGSAYDYKTPTSGSVYSNQQYGFKITPPTGWFIDESKRGDALVGFIDRTNNAQAIISVSVINEPEVNSSNFDLYIENGVQQVKTFSGGLVISNNKITSSSKPSYLTESKIAVKENGALLHSLQLSLLAKNGQIFVVSGVSMDDNLWSLFKNAITDSIKSFSVN